MNRRSKVSFFSALLVLSSSLGAAGWPAPAVAQSPVLEEGAHVGYEMALSGSFSSERGASLLLTGVAYEVEGLATLRPTAGLEVEATLSAYQEDGSVTDLGSTHVRSAAGGQFEIALPVPESTLSSPWVLLRVHRAGQPGRTFQYPVSQLASRTGALLTDRERYEPGETMHLFALVRGVRDRAPVAQRALRIEVIDPRGATLLERELATGSSGAVSTDVELLDSAMAGTYQIRLAFDPAVSPVVRNVEVVQRTTDRVAASVTLDQDVVGPGEHLTGRVRVTTPSGAPIRGAQVELHVGRGSGEISELVTDAAGIARIDTTAPTFLSGEVSVESAWARVTHPAYGSITASASYTLSRTRWLVSAVAEAGGLVPEVDSQLYLTVNDPRGRPITAGATLDVTGLGIAGGRQHLTVDAQGVAIATVRLPRGAAARLSGGDCAGQGASTTFDVEVGTTPPISASVCARVALDAQVLPRVRTPIVAPGAHVDVDVLRRPTANGRAVLLEVLYGSRAVASTWVAGGAQSAQIALPAGLQGVMSIRARPVSAADAHAPVDQPGATFFGVGASAAVLVRPSDAFSLSVTPDRPLHAVREHAQVAIATSAAPTRTWVTMVARDEAQLAGEGDYAVEWILGQLREAVRSGGTTHERFVRAALAAGVSPDEPESRAAPLVSQPWDDGSRYYGAGEGILRDPIAAREELVRRGIGQLMSVLEGVVQQLGSQQELRDQVTRASGRRVDFSPDVVEWLVNQGYVSPEAVTTLGGQRMTVAMITQADPSFTFDNAARRVARARLVRLLVALSSLTNADDPSALRASAGAPPDRWLSLLVQLGVLEPDALVDPWGHAFVMHRVTGRHPAVVVSERALEWELSSPGPDGVAGNADDVRDPFARVVPHGTPYAVVSGEDPLMVQLSQIAPGEHVLAAMATAYQRLGLAAQEEMRGGVVTATTSEATAMPMAPPPSEAMYAMDDTSGYGMGTGGYGGEGELLAPEAQMAAPSRARISSAELELREEPADVDQDSVVDAVDVMPMASGLIREDFPATLFYVGEVELDASGHATVDVPLADAITTYRLEAIAWTQSGWITSGRGSVRVDQTATVDAPVPEAATVGDHLRIPVRLQNRTDAPVRARIEVAVEGAFTVDVGATGVVEAGPHDAAEQIVDVTLTGAGEGALVVRASSEDGAALDAVRRPMHVFEDARLVRQHLEALVENDATVSLTLPARAMARGPADLRLSVAGSIFGDPADLAGNDPFWGGFGYAMDRQPLPDGLAAQLAQYVHYQEDYGVPADQYFAGRDVLQLALVVGALYGDAHLDGASVEAALRAIAVQFPDAASTERSAYYGYGPRQPASFVLLALAPAARSTAMPEHRESLDRVLTLLRRAAADEGAEAVDAPETWVRVAAALALTRRSGDDDARANEMLRRAERSVVTVGDIAWLEPDVEDGSAEPRVAPTSLLALARIASGDRQGALPLVRSLAQVSRGALRWPALGRALAGAAASLLTTGTGTGPIAITIDGTPVELTTENGVATASLESASRPGAHVLRFALPAGALAMLRLDVRYGMPWDVEPDRPAPVEIEWSGTIGARDTRSGMSLTLQNRGTRVLTRPTVDIEMPAGTELDEPTRDAMSALLAEPPTIEGTTWHLVLRPIAPAGVTRIPVRARWALSGSLRGFGVSFVDEAGPSIEGLHPTAILASRGVEISDRGPEASAEPPSVAEVPRPPPPPPILRPLAEDVR
ncbi:MAG: MG2 domain-containing protein [Sandaracinus sp.]